MRNVWSMLVMLLLALIGCRSKPDLRPPTQPECYALPPEDDKRYSQPYQYSKETTNPLASPSRRNSGGPPGGMGGGPGGMMGGGGGMMGPGGMGMMGGRS